MMIGRNQKRVRKQMRQIILAELASAANAGNLNTQMRLVELYLSGGMDEAAYVELNRLMRQFPKHPLVLTRMIEVLVKKKSHATLNNVVNVASRVAESSAELRLATANAFTVLKRFEAASSQYTELLRSSRITPQVLQQLSDFICQHPATRQLMEIVTTLAEMYVKPPPPLLSYILCRAFTDTECYQEADEYLSLIRPWQIDRPQILFDLAVLSFRLADLAKAVEMANRALEISQEHASARALLVSVYSFAGRIDKALQHFRMLIKPYSPLLLSQSQLTAVLQFAVNEQHPKPDSGVIIAEYRTQNGKRISYTNQSAPVGEGESYVQTVSVSVFGTNRTDARPWDILMNIDRMCPHIMVQRLKDSRILHAFVPSGNKSRWPWQEVTLFIHSNQEMVDQNKIRFMTDENNGMFRNTKCVPNKLFEQFKKEIQSTSILEELQQW